MSDSFFTDAELDNLRKISKEEIGELIEELKGESGAAGAAANAWAEAAHRKFHKITGSAGVAGLVEIGELAAEAESLSDPENGPPDKSAFIRIHKIVGSIERLLKA
ncbi:MAG: Hpt domain-containing protein [bacterium]